MTKHRIWVFASAFAVLTAGAFVGSQAAEALKARPTAVAIVDMEKILNELTEKVQIEADLKTRQQKYQQERMDKQKEIEQLKGDLEVLGQNTAKFKEAQESLERKAFDFQAWDQWQNASLAREYRLQGQALQNKVAAAVGKLAEAGGYDAVLPKQQNIRVPAGNGQVYDQGIRVALWSKPDLDITARVIQQMNNEWVNKKP